MPPDSRTIDEEGVLIDNELMVDEGHFREAEIRNLLRSGEWPARNPDRNISDLKAQLAACTRGAEVLAQTARDYGPEVVAAYMNHVLANAEESVRRLLDRLDDGAFDYEMDNGAWVRVKITTDKAERSATFDFTGTSGQLPDNFNAPFSIVRAASLYVARTLIDDAIPMNDGCLRPIKLVVPEGSMLNPKSPAAVVAGNVETSQVVTDALFAATGRLAPSQGTMNNFTFGNERHQYYETIAGGSGAGPDHDRQGGAVSDVRFHRHKRATARQFQCTLLHRARGLPLRGANAHRRRHPDERRLPAADPAGRAGWVDAQPELSRRGGRGECRNEPGGDRCLVRRHRAACAEPGDDEQLHLRQRSPPIL
jgi:N-methylhydantoinase B/oxoprolinase/acetone carboxylase alpha subunit